MRVLGGLMCWLLPLPLVSCGSEAPEGLHYANLKNAARRWLAVPGSSWITVHRTLCTLRKLRMLRTLPRLRKLRTLRNLVAKNLRDGVPRTVAAAAYSAAAWVNSCSEVEPAPAGRSRPVASTSRQRPLRSRTRRPGVAATGMTVTRPGLSTCGVLFATRAAAASLG